jgi:hypothetical protein
MRLWIVSALVLWSAGVVHVILEEQPVPLPPILMSRHDLCFAYYVHAAEVSGPWEDYGRGGYLDNLDNTAEQCMTDDSMLADTREWHWRGFIGVWRWYWPWWIAPFALGALMLGIRWIQRGFAR